MPFGHAADSSGRRAFGLGCRGSYPYYRPAVGHPGAGNFLVSNGWSSMGFAIPAAIAAKLVQPQRPVAVVVGDGGFLMKVGEINTAVRLKLPVIFVVFRDRS